MKLIDRVTFKRFVIIISAVKNNMSLQHLNFLDKLFDTYVNYILMQGKSEREIHEAIEQLESNFYIKRLLKDWYWEYADKVKNLNEPEQFMWLLKEMKDILSKVKNAEFVDSYKNKMSNDYIDLISDAELFE